MPIPDLKDKDEQEIKEVKDKGMIKDQIHYLVKQEGQPTKYNQQILEEDIGNVKLAIKRFKETRAKQAKAKD